MLLAIGVYAIVLFSQHREHVDVTVTENYRSVLAVQQMKLALTRMEEGVLTAQAATSARADEQGASGAAADF